MVTLRPCQVFEGELDGRRQGIRRRQPGRDRTGPVAENAVSRLELL